MLDDFVFRLLPVTGKAFLLDFQARGAVIAAPQFDNVLAKTAQGAQLAPELIGGLAVPIRQRGGVAGGEDGGQMLRQRAIRGVSQFFGVGDQFADLGQGVVPREPVAVTALFPLGKILLADGASRELAGQDRLRLRAVN